MAIKISRNVALNDIVSTGNNSNPIASQHPLTGSTVEIKLYLFNDNPAERFENISIDPIDTTGSDESVWVQLAPDNGGSAGEYLAAGEALAMPNISDSNIGKPFWYRITTPNMGGVQNKTDIKLSVSCRKFAV